MVWVQEGRDGPILFIYSIHFSFDSGLGCYSLCLRDLNPPLICHLFLRCLLFFFLILHPLLPPHPSSSSFFLVFLLLLLFFPFLQDLNLPTMQDLNPPSILLCLLFFFFRFLQPLLPHPSLLLPLHSSSSSFLSSFCPLLSLPQWYHGMFVLCVRMLKRTRLMYHVSVCWNGLGSYRFGHEPAWVQ